MNSAAPACSWEFRRRIAPAHLSRTTDNLEREAATGTGWPQQPRRHTALTIVFTPHHSTTYCDL